MLGARCLSALGQHGGRPVRVGWVQHETSEFTQGRFLDQKFRILWHTATLVELDHVPETIEGAPYMLISFK